MKNQQGYIALISILIISALVLLLGISANLLSISESDMSLQTNQASEVYYLATACVEDALMKLKDNLNYGGNEILIFDNGTCTIKPLEGVENKDRVIKTFGNAYNQVRRIKIEINRVNPNMEIKSWQQVAEF